MNVVESEEGEGRRERGRSKPDSGGVWGGGSSRAIGWRWRGHGSRAQPTDCHSHLGRELMQGGIVTGNAALQLLDVRDPLLEPLVHVEEAANGKDQEGEW